MWIVAPGRPSEATVARDVVGVIVRFEHMLDSNAVQTGKVEVWLDVPLRVDDRDDALADVADQIRRASEVLMDHLSEQHRARFLLPRSEAVTPYPATNPPFLTKIVENG